MTLWSKFKAYLKGWPESSKSGKQDNEGHTNIDVLPIPVGGNFPNKKAKKPKGLNAKKKRNKERKARKQGNLS
tara:strand:- start:503 stop:721 length:219 start_codon:yes stop_codon:yes gene_type:complete